MDISEQFFELANKKSVISGHHDKRKAAQKKLFRDKPLRDKNDVILKAAIKILHNVDLLQAFLNENREAYVDTSKHVSTRSSAMTDEQRDLIDSKSLELIEMCNGNLNELDKVIQERHRNNPPPKRTYSDNGDDDDMSILRDDPDNMFVRRIDQFDSRVYMYFNILDQLKEHLHHVSENFKKQRSFRLSSKARETERFYSSLEASSRAKLKDTQSTTAAAATASGDRSIKSSGGISALIGEEDSSEQQVFRELDLDEEQTIIYEQQNALLINELNTLSDQMVVIERQIEELTQLFDEITPHIMAQRETIDTIYSTNVDATNYIERANNQMQEATKKSFDFRIMVLIFLITLSIALLFLNWYQD
ncbi:hypothetical protein SAMD00019534_021650 [Acytostelium subglobosum LB1]|uniref:hypothetical protein n=1 Tax=Acytostelium subglobosum LB1 TaxID=1410327 RepID=UPI000644D0DF|nr:hypothetical protein SAMD00019534_021650 [Acytostelium subglobosum LB1]GAM18990.1 hypothetical protein SAMD00019534_021650 [Acytostelium subglobosum LB1]|eukprot:XP_012756917.1 hypothetical protein SAMD00019534_021650 [Acytostelium subglobosum LB1]